MRWSWVDTLKEAVSKRVLVEQEDKLSWTADRSKNQSLESTIEDKVSRNLCKLAKIDKMTVNYRPNVHKHDLSQLFLIFCINVFEKSLGTQSNKSTNAIIFFLPFFFQFTCFCFVVLNLFIFSPIFFLNFVIVHFETKYFKQ